MWVKKPYEAINVLLICFQANASAEGRDTLNQFIAQQGTFYCFQRSIATHQAQT